MEWPFQELLLLREQYQREFKNSTYSRKSCRACRCSEGLHLDAMPATGLYIATPPYSNTVEG